MSGQVMITMDERNVVFCPLADKHSSPHSALFPSPDGFLPLFTLSLKVLIAVFSCRECPDTL